MQVWSVEDASEDPGRTRVVGVEQRLVGHAVRHQPHGQEEQEEEHVLHLWGDEAEEEDIQSKPEKKKMMMISFICGEMRQEKKKMMISFICGEMRQKKKISSQNQRRRR